MDSEAIMFSILPSTSGISTAQECDVTTMIYEGTNLKHVYYFISIKFFCYTETICCLEIQEVPIVKCVVCADQVMEDDLTAFGCDGTCDQWFHRECLEPDDRARADVSLMCEVEWLCPICCANLERICAVCTAREYVVDQGPRSEAEWASCKNCTQWYHYHHLSRAAQYAYDRRGRKGWLCPQCMEE